MVIVSAGLVSPVGLSLPETAAATRARVARLREIDWYDRRHEPFIVGQVPEAGLPPLSDALAGLPLQPREVCMLRMAQVALEEAVTPLKGSSGPLPLLLGLPEQHTTLPIQPASFLQRLGLQAPTLVDAGRSMAAARGRAAGLMALREGVARLRRGESAYVLVGGVDSLVDPYVLGTLDLQGRVRNSVNNDGLSPAEGAAMLLLSLASTAQAQGLQPLANLLGTANGHEPGHLYAEEPYKGEGLAATFAALLAEAPPPQPIASVFCSFNGERYWAREYGVARLRQSHGFAEDHAVEHPAECFGDLGAAHGPALAALAAHGLRHGYRHGPSLVFAASDHGDRAASLLATAR